MDLLYVIKPTRNISSMLGKMLYSFCSNFHKVIMVESMEDIPELRAKKLLFVLELGSSHNDLTMLKFIENLKNKDGTAFEDSIGTLLIHSSSELGTKRAAQDMVFLANNMGCSFIGHPLIEATDSLANFLNWQKKLNVPLENICLELCSKLGQRLLKYNSEIIKSPKITVLYTSPHKFSNTLHLWHMISKNLKDYIIEEIQIENGEVHDCKGCSYKTCLHYGKQNTCFYGGFMTSSVLPSIEKAHAVVWLCPNYNDSLAANLTAVINRLTVLYNKMSFYNKNLFSVIVSGNSGSDSVAKQLIGALNINKGFRLPKHALLMETANDPNAIYKIESIEKKAYNFASNMKSEIKCSLS